jgi:hypothetical protein
MSVLCIPVGRRLGFLEEAGHEDPSSDEGNEGDGSDGTGTLLIRAELATGCAVDTLNLGLADSAGSGVWDVCAV